MKQPVKTLIVICSLLVLPLLAQAQTEPDPVAGQQKALICSACHGQNGMSIAPNFANLAGQGEKYLIKQIHDIKNDDRTVLEMTGMLAALTESDIADIAAYYASLPTQTMGSQAIDDADWDLSSEEFLALGEKIYRFGNPDSGLPSCTGCHSPTGAGNAPAGFPALGGQHSEYLVAQLDNFRSNRRTNDGESQIMRGAVAYMTDLEVRAVANYISGLQP